MRRLSFAAVLLFTIIAEGCVSQLVEGQRSGPSLEGPMVKRVPVIVELFTSEGCSSCPPADRALRFLAEQQPVSNAEVIPLAFHVDYWNYLGWKDPFSSAAFSRRQEMYVERFKLNSGYTPEMVVDGRAEFVGSDTGAAARQIADAAVQTKGTVSLAVEGDTLNVSIIGLPAQRHATVFLAATEDGLTSDVRAGENGGQKLQHVGVVRSLTLLATVEKGANSFQKKVDFPNIPEWNTSNGRLVVFVQDNDDGRILAAAAVSARP